MIILACPGQSCLRFFCFLQSSVATVASNDCIQVTKSSISLREIWLIFVCTSFWIVTESNLPLLPSKQGRNISEALRCLPRYTSSAICFLQGDLSTIQEWVSTCKCFDCNLPEWVEASASWWLLVTNFSCFSTNFLLLQINFRYGVFTAVRIFTATDTFTKEPS